MSQEDRLAHLQSVHGAKIMVASILATYSSFSTTFQPSQEHMWFGCYTNDTLMVVKGVSPNGCASYSQVLDNHTLQPYTFDCSYLQHLWSTSGRVVAKIGKKWMLHPYPSIAHMFDMLWLYAKDPVATDHKGSLLSVLSKTWKIIVPFFQYSVKLGRSLLLSRNARILAAQKHWTT